MCATAGVLATRLAEHKAVVSVRYPGLAGDPAHGVAKRQMNTYGSMLSLTFKDGTAAERFINDCPLIQPSTSFGGVRTSAERRVRWGDAVPEGFVRLSVGLEPAETLWRAIQGALEKID
jgi:cystathionine gamma-lyase